jgi:mono/diheme cytochrome c family protein
MGRPGGTDMRTLIAIVIGLLAVFVAGALFVYAGVYDVAATKQHIAPVYWLLEATMRQSVRRHARDIVVPPLTDPIYAARGRALYDEHCVRCHGAPGVAPEPFALGLTPVPANLTHTAREWPPAELFWVVKHGIKMAGMPAWEFRFADGDLWAIVAYLQVMPHESPAQYRSGARGASASAPIAKETAPGRVPAAGEPDRGRIALEQYACATCHVIPGVVGANAPVGPPLASIGTRGLIAGMLPNNADNMVRWLRAPQATHPGSAMPDLGVTERDARDIAAYLYTLK